MTRRLRLKALRFCNLFSDGDLKRDFTQSRKARQEMQAKSKSFFAPLLLGYFA
jgi:hypothetical protein